MKCLAHFVNLNNLLVTVSKIIRTNDYNNVDYNADLKSCIAKFILCETSLNFRNGSDLFNDVFNIRDTVASNDMAVSE
jgi:hypothetical protein